MSDHRTHNPEIKTTDRLEAWMRENMPAPDPEKPWQFRRRIAAAAGIATLAALGVIEGGQQAFNAAKDALKGPSAEEVSKNVHRPSTEEIVADIHRGTPASETEVNQQLRANKAE